MSYTFLSLIASITAFLCVDFLNQTVFYYFLIFFCVYLIDIFFVDVMGLHLPS